MSWGKCIINMYTLYFFHNHHTLFAHNDIHLEHTCGHVWKYIKTNRVEEYSYQFNYMCNNLNSNRLHMHSIVAWGQNFTWPDIIIITAQLFFPFSTCLCNTLEYAIIVLYPHKLKLWLYGINQSRSWRGRGGKGHHMF